MIENENSIELIFANFQEIQKENNLLHTLLKQNEGEQDI